MGPNRGIENKAISYRGEDGDEGMDLPKLFDAEPVWRKVVGY